MKLDKTDKTTPNPETKPKSKPKTAPPQYQGSRFGSLILLIVTVLISLAFYASGQ